MARERIPGSVFPPPGPRAYLLRTIDDEVAPGIKRTLIKLTQVSVCQAAQEAVCGAEHDRNFTNEGFLMLGLNLVLPLLDDGLCDVDIQGSRITEEEGVTTTCQSVTRLQYEARPA